MSEGIFNVIQTYSNSEPPNEGLTLEKMRHCVESLANRVWTPPKVYTNQRTFNLINYLDYVVELNRTVKRFRYRTLRKVLHKHKWRRAYEFDGDTKRDCLVVHPVIPDNELLRLD